MSAIPANGFSQKHVTLFHDSSPKRVEKNSQINKRQARKFTEIEGLLRS